MFGIAQITSAVSTEVNTIKKNISGVLCLQKIRVIKHLNAQCSLNPFNLLVLLFHFSPSGQVDQTEAWLLPGEGGCSLSLTARWISREKDLPAWLKSD